MHSRKVVHRDMHMGNVLLGNGYPEIVSLWISDFGAWLMETPRGEENWLPPTGGGTALSPEVVFSSRFSFRGEMEWPSTALQG